MSYLGAEESGNNCWSPNRKCKTKVHQQYEATNTSVQRSMVLFNCKVSATKKLRY